MNNKEEPQHRTADQQPEWLIDLARVINDPGYDRWRTMVAATGGCAHPVHLAGESLIVNATNGEVLHSYRTTDEPSGHLLVACGNRRASVCPSCSEVYRADTFQLIRAGRYGPAVLVSATRSVSTGIRSAAMLATSRETDGSGNLSATGVTTTWARCSGRPTQARCGIASPWKYGAPWPARRG